MRPYKEWEYNDFISIPKKKEEKKKKNGWEQTRPHLRR